MSDLYLRLIRREKWDRPPEATSEQIPHPVPPLPPVVPDITLKGWMDGYNARGREIERLSTLLVAQGVDPHTGEGLGLSHADRIVPVRVGGTVLGVGQIADALPHGFVIVRRGRT